MTDKELIELQHELLKFQRDLINDLKTRLDFKSEPTKMTTDEKGILHEKIFKTLRNSDENTSYSWLANEIVSILNV